MSEKAARMIITDANGTATGAGGGGFEAHTEGALQALQVWLASVDTLLGALLGNALAGLGL
jgi:hypothetical protein